ncbi:hypothetical protein OG582_38800 (plasmid) [Streptomyces anulatus]|uniref:hypothetical protein n=1 Tax=Streptomyces anulatus TaxID=1892 RepID=UPI00324E61EC|nr:hypothetical protein OH737_39155 [Streptomyces anulatus]
MTLANSADITQTSDGATELTEFATRNTASLDGATPGDIGTLRSKYKVLNVDMTKVANTLGATKACEVKDETLVAPRSATGITYIVNPDQEFDPDYNPALGLDPCKLNLEWEAVTPDETAQDDGVDATARPYPQMIASDCFARKWHVEKSNNVQKKSSWNDACYQNWVERFDGNGSWNYYTKKALSTCGVTVGRLISCGHGVKRNTSGPAVQWMDWAPTASQDRNDCRTRSIGVSLLNVSVGGDFDLCERQLINKYAEAGKMSGYWKGKVQSARSTAHQVAVKVGQNAGRPKWKHWTNSDVCWACWQD